MTKTRSLIGGFTLLELMIVIAIIAILVAIAVPAMLGARKNANEGCAIGAMRIIVTEQVIFRDGDKEQDGNNDYGMLSELSNTQLVDALLGGGTKSGYLFEAAYSYTSSNFLWFATARPFVPTITGDRYFAVNHGGVAYYTGGASFALDTSTCVLPNTAIPSIPVGK